MKRLCVVTCTYREQPLFWPMVEHMLKSAAAAPDVELHWTVVDAGLWYYPAREAKLKKAIDGRIPYRHLEPVPSAYRSPTVRHGFDHCRAKNTALRTLDGDYVVFLDDRCLVSPSWVPAIRERMVRGEGFTPYRPVSDFLKAPEDYVRGEVHDVAPQAVLGICASPLAMALDVGGYDESYSGFVRTLYEDADYAERCRRAGLVWKRDARCAVLEVRGQNHDHKWPFDPEPGQRAWDTLMSEPERTRAKCSLLVQ